MQKCHLWPSLKTGMVGGRVSRWLALKILGERWPEGGVLEVGMYAVLFSLVNRWSLKIMRSVRVNVSPCHSP